MVLLQCSVTQASVLFLEVATHIEHVHPKMSHNDKVKKLGSSQHIESSRTPTLSQRICINHQGGNQQFSQEESGVGTLPNG